MAMEARTTLARPLRIARTTILHRVTAFVVTHPVWAIFLLALAIRLTVVAAIAIVHPSNIAPDGVAYSALAADKATGHTAGWSGYDHTLYHVTATLLLPLTWLYELFGVHQVLGQLYVALLGACTAALVTRLAMEVLPKRWSVAVGLIVALLPTQIVWSSLILKDAPVWCVLAALALTVAVAGRSRGLRLLALGMLVVVLMLLLGYLRLYTLIFASWALMLAVFLGPRTQRVPQIVGAVAIAVLIPWMVFDLGPAGVTYLKGSPAPSDLRSSLAVGAKSALPGARKSATPSSTVTSASSGSSAPSETTTDVSYLPRGLLAMLVQPYPWQTTGSTYLKIARVDAIIWYPLLLLAIVGLLTLRLRHLHVMAFPLLVGGAILLSYALIEGNLGTAFRHRGEFEWVIALLAGFALWRLVRWRSENRPVPYETSLVSGARRSATSGPPKHEADEAVGSASSR